MVVYQRWYTVWLTLQIVLRSPLVSSEWLLEIAYVIFIFPTINDKKPYKIYSNVCQANSLYKYIVLYCWWPKYLSNFQFFYCCKILSSTIYNSCYDHHTSIWWMMEYKLHDFIILIVVVNITSRLYPNGLPYTTVSTTYNSQPVQQGNNKKLPTLDEVDWGRYIAAMLVLYDISPWQLVLGLILDTVLAYW